MVDARTDIPNLVKFLYLKNCFTGEALNKIVAYGASEENYKNAWTLLQDAYERKRILMSKHLDAILDIPSASEASSKGLAGMIDIVRQHVTMLEMLELRPKDHVIVRILERALPSIIRLKWEESLTLDAIPTLEQFYKFINETVFRLHTMERDVRRPKNERGEKRRGEHDTQGVKAKRFESGSRALVTSISASCTQCKGEHVIYRCPIFEKMTVQQRWNSIKDKKLCRNCLRNHIRECTSTRCKHCNRFHHTLLHYTKSLTSSTPLNVASTSNTKSETATKSQ